MRGLTQLGGTTTQQVGGMQVPTLPTTVAENGTGLDISSIMNMMIMMMIVVMMMKMMTGAIGQV